MRPFSTFRKPLIVFVYADRYKHSGSTIMRGAQLLSIVKRFHGKQFRLKYRPLSTDYRNCLVFLTKGAVTDITADQIIALIKRGNKVVLDPVDNPLDSQKANSATAVIAASLEAFDAYSKQGFRTYLINHHVDTRLPRKASTPPANLRCGYFGELVNTIITDQISRMVDFVHVDTGKQSNDWLAKPCQYNLHYAVRSANVEAFKPFLKGFTAAACDANIIIQKDQVEAVRWLGEDYPFLLPANPTEQDIINMLLHIQSVFGDGEWKRALQKMNEIKQRTSDNTIADEFAAMAQALFSV
jgi:hypothetical protein